MPSAQLIARNTPFLLVFSDAPSLIDKAQVQSALNRVRRSTNNYYTYSDRHEREQREHIERFRSTGPRLLQSRKQLKNRRKQQLQVPPTTDSADPTTTPADVTVVLLDGVGSNAYSRQKCAKHQLVVQFRDIGWEHWIIAPKSFEGHYCAGTCPFPLSPVSTRR
jgi:DNA-binding transcriptional MerR regulator